MPGEGQRSALDVINERGYRGALSPGNHTGKHGSGGGLMLDNFGDNRNGKTGAPVDYVMQPENDGDDGSVDSERD